MSYRDLLSYNGLETKDQPTLISDIGGGMQNIFGTDIIITPNSPEGQIINLVAQQCIDQRELIAETYNSFNPDLASGVVLDQRLAINNIQRAGGTYTVVPITIVTSSSCALIGLDGNYNTPTGTEYTIQDNSGNQFILINSVSLTAGTNIINFRASTIGAVTPTANTITTPVTIVLGVTSVNNPSGTLSIGVNQETDSAVKIRRIQSLANSSSNYINGLLGSILALDSVVSAKLYENYTNVTDAYGIPAHCIWLIVNGGSSSDIANAMYSKKTAGTNMKGTQTYNITTINGGTFQAQWDIPSALALYIKFNIQKTVSTATFDQTAIKNYIVASLIYGIGGYSDTSHITSIVQAAIDAQGGGGVPTVTKISTDNVNWYDYIAVTTLDQQFTVSTSNIAITVL